MFIPITDLIVRIWAIIVPALVEPATANKTNLLVWSAFNFHLVSMLSYAFIPYTWALTVYLCIRIATRKAGERDSDTLGPNSQEKLATFKWKFIIPLVALVVATTVHVRANIRWFKSWPRQYSMIGITILRSSLVICLTFIVAMEILYLSGSKFIQQFRNRTSGALQTLKSKQSRMSNKRNEGGNQIETVAVDERRGSQRFTGENPLAQKG